jgi:hypothetical protein
MIDGLAALHRSRSGSNASSPPDFPFSILPGILLILRSLRAFPPVSVLDRPSGLEYRTSPKIRRQEAGVKESLGPIPDF